MPVPTFRFDEFQCERCGTCCLNEEIIRLTIVDLFRLAGALKVSPANFFKKYCTIADPFGRGRRSINLKTRGGCPFYQNSTCTVYEVRPYICRAFPFTYPELEHAIYRWNSLTFDRCSLSKVPYTSVLEGNGDLLVEEGIAVLVTNQYLEDYRFKFDEQAARKYVELFDSLKESDEVRASTRKLIAEEAQAAQAAACRPENYYGLFVFFSGFYNLYMREVEEVQKAGEVLSVIPQVHGIEEDSIYIQLGNSDYAKVKKLLSSQKDLSIKIKALMNFNDEEWNSVSICSPNTTMMTFCGTRKDQKGRLNRKPGEISLVFANTTNNNFRIAGKDDLNWLSGEYPVPPVEYRIPEHGDS